MDRRTFVTTGIAAGTALALGKSPLAFTTRKPDEIRVAVAGIRSRGWAHVQGLNRLEGVRNAFPISARQTGPRADPGSCLLVFAGRVCGQP